MFRSVEPSASSGTGVNARPKHDYTGTTEIPLAGRRSVRVSPKRHWRVTSLEMTKMAPSAVSTVNSTTLPNTPAW